MRVSPPIRVMWLLNHTTARKFELSMLRSIGVEEIFTPKIIPADPSFRSASISHQDDHNLTIPEEDLNVLNGVNWYESAQHSDWKLASKYFDICFVILHDISTFKAFQYFDGIVLWRAYGLDQSLSYSRVLDILSNGLGETLIRNAGRKFIFAPAYDHLSAIESNVFISRSVHLPLGLHSVDIKDEWQGGNGRIFFVCPDIGFNPYYHQIYLKFISDFKGFNYAIGGSQPIDIDDQNVLGYVIDSEHQENMKKMGLMFYHSQEPNHIHYHPFEAVRAGMPLIFMSNGMLDRMGGTHLPGRCTSIEEARNKISRILSGDREFIELVRKSQVVLLNSMNPKNLKHLWETGFQRIRQELETYRHEMTLRPVRSKTNRIAVILAAPYRGGSFRAAKLLVHALHLGASQYGDAVELVFLHLIDGKYATTELNDLPEGVKTRGYQWKKLEAKEARRAMRYSGNSCWEPAAQEYVVADDGVKQLGDCDLWIVVSDRLAAPLLPLRPVVHMVYDYLQRYVPMPPTGVDQPYINAARAATQVWTTTEFTRQDALQYAGVDARRVIKLPMLAPKFTPKQITNARTEPPYFVWTTNAAPHKNHEHALRALRALQLYYAELNGSLNCHVTGVNTHHLLHSPPEHLKRTMAWVRTDEPLKRHVKWPGELPDTDYQRLLQGAAFLWHAGRIDNGTFSVVEAAGLGVPALSSDYPPMREMDAQFGLNLAWMDASDPVAMARALKAMEEKHLERRALLPTAEQLACQSVEQLAGAYWKAATACL